MSVKNKVQEHYQKLKLAVPKYNTEKCGGPDHAPEFISTIVLACGKSMIGEICSTKMRAEESAAEVAFMWLIENDKIVKKRTVLLIDGENVSKQFLSDLAALPCINGLTAYIFIGSNHHLSGKEFVNATKIISPSTRSDGTDTCMQVHVGYFLALNSYDVYLIATRDHFGYCLVDMITSPTLMWGPKKSAVITDVKEIYDHA